MANRYRNVEGRYCTKKQYYTEKVWAAIIITVAAIIGAATVVAMCSSCTATHYVQGTVVKDRDTAGFVFIERGRIRE